ncbi:apolipoprotein N-acyltransferase [Pseudothioclava arenosa]|uniref:Apolipoprotein N-acyltransferase n=1 Tax=Pseudothioclava arenosa TaxID=1795308 RepID=A0A2A4CS65_9RHOB|nr:apolipoprotein N-acyltransferase [Pseudothioclava arenosa]PCD77445.1 apolipoprotein N-acyltransferase [Pseudothioclava arenosa]
MPRALRLFRAPLRPGWLWLLAAMALGAGVALGQAPFGLWPVAALALAGVIGLAARPGCAGSAAWIGFAAGFGYALAAMHWIVEPFFVEAEIYGWMAPFALVLMAAGMGLFWALATGAGAALAGPGAPRPWGVALGFAASDALRSYVFTGFPWVLLGHVWLDSPVAQVGALIGPIGLSLLTTFLAAGLVAGLRALAARRWAGLLVPLVLIAGTSGLGLWGQAQLAVPVPVRETPVRLRLIQPNAAQHLKWQADYAREFFLRHLDLTGQLPLGGARRPDLILWPETAVPFLLEDAGVGLEMIAEAAGGRSVVLGIQRGEGRRFYNSLAVIAPDAQVTAVYDKTHLVPFGEYIPFGDLAARLGISAFAAQEGNGYTAGAGETLLDLGPLGRVVPLICYEAVFPQDIRAVAGRADWLLQITNDAWFGQGSGPRQHLAQARMRAIEQGLPLARAANTGISALIDARGRIVEQIALGEIGWVDADLPGSLPATVYARRGDWPVFALIVALGLVVSTLRRKYRVDRQGKPS